MPALLGREPGALAEALPLPTLLQRFVDFMEATVELHRACLDDAGQPRQGLTTREQQQARPAHALGLRLWMLPI